MSSFSFHRSDFGDYLPLSELIKFQQTAGSVLYELFREVSRIKLEKSILMEIITPAIPRRF
jgi:hypothetical protein